MSTLLVVGYVCRCIAAVLCTAVRESSFGISYYDIQLNLLKGIFSLFTIKNDSLVGLVVGLLSKRSWVRLPGRAKCYWVFPLRIP